MHNSNPFNFRKNQDLQEQILVERLNFANDICETLEMSPEDLIGLLSELVEAVEQLDELSPKTLASYIGKAHSSGVEAEGDMKDALRQSHTATWSDPRWRFDNRKQVTGDSYHEKNLTRFWNGNRRQHNRSRGIRTAARMLANEAGKAPK